MSIIAKKGSTSGIIPSLIELHAIGQLKQSWKKLIKTSSLNRGTWWREILNADWSDVQRSWREIKYYRQSKILTKALAPIIQSVPNGKCTEDKLKKAVKAYPELSAVWGMKYKHPEKVHASFTKLVERSEQEPTRITLVTGGSDWIYKGNHYELSAAYSDEHAKLLILREFDREREFFEHLHRRYNEGVSATTSIRERIPERVRIEVWRRDGGKCARCGSRENLEDDHIIPVSKAGSNSARNIELLCEKCNRAKSASIG